MNLFLVFFALLGHAFFWIGLVNRLHSVGIRRWIIDSLTVLFFFCSVTIPLGVAFWFNVNGFRRPSQAIIAYAVACWIVAAITLCRFVWFLFLYRTPSIVRFRGRRRVNIHLESATIAPEDNSHHFLARLPLNEALRLDLTDWMLDVPRLPPALDGLSIVHLSDFHFTGRVGKAFFREVVRVSNELQPDLVALTGDLLESPNRLDWIPDTLGQLKARHGVYFVLGNHDLRLRVARQLRQLLEQCGLISLGGRTHRIEINGQPILLMGTEYPWIKDEPVADRTACGSPGTTAPLRIALSHTPDRFAWARAQDVDLMLAGHTHGGQICIPPLGPICSPSAWGVKHIAGIYHSPPTILHVTRGISGDTPIRWHCSPEIARLTLTTSIRG
jgi:uncharacterized protein